VIPARPLVVALVALAASLPFARHSNPVRDDKALLAAPPGAGEAFGTDWWGGRAGSSGLYRPVARTLDGVLARDWGLGARGQKAASAVLHAAASVLVLPLSSALSLSASGSLAAALLFAAHPVHAEVFGEIAGRAEVLAALFSIVALLGVLRGRILGAAGAGVAALLACLSKESALALPGVAVLLAGRAGWRRSLPGVAAIAAAAAAALALRAAVLGSPLGLDPAGVPVVDNPVAALSYLEGRRFALAVLAHAGAMLLFPIRLSADYSLGAIEAPGSWGDPRVLAGLAIAIGAALAAVRAARRTSAAGAFGAAAALVAYLPASQLPLSIGALFGERFLYFPSAFAAIAAGAILPWRRGGRVAGAALAAIVFLFLTRGALRSADFASDLDLYRAAETDRPGGARAPAAIAHELNSAGLLGEALASVDRSLAICPRWPTALSLRGAILMGLGRKAESADVFRAAVEATGGGDFAAWWNYAAALRAIGDRDGAIGAYEEAMRLDPRERARCEAAIRSLR